MSVKSPAVRSYVVGLPVVITVHADGTVSVSVDTSEAADAIVETAQYDPDSILEDAALVQRLHDGNVL